MENKKDNKISSKVEEFEWKIMGKLLNNKIVNNLNKLEVSQTTPIKKTASQKKKTIYTNFIAKKFNLIIFIMKTLGYSITFIMALIFLSNEYEFGLVWAILIAIFTWLSTLFYEAVAEIIQKLQNIEDNTKNKEV